MKYNNLTPSFRLSPSWLLTAVTIILTTLLLPLSVSANHENNQQWDDQQWSNDHIIVFSECGYAGLSKALPVGDFNRMRLIGVKRNEISSIIIPEGLAVEIFQKRDFGGHWYRLNQNQICLKGKWNDRIASLRVVEDIPDNSYGWSEEGAHHGNNKNCHPYTVRAIDGDVAVRFVDQDQGLNTIRRGQTVDGEVCSKKEVRLELAKQERRAEVVLTINDQDYVFERWSQYDDYRDGWYRKYISFELPKSRRRNNDDVTYGANGWGNTKGFGKRYSSGMDNGQNWGNNYRRDWNKPKPVVVEQPKAQPQPQVVQNNQPSCTTYSVSANHQDTGLRFLVGDQKFHFIGNGSSNKQICHKGRVQVELAKKRKPAQVVLRIAGQSYVFKAGDGGDRYARDWYRKYHWVNIP